MRRLTTGILIMALVVMAVGCSSVQFNMTEPRAAQLTPKSGGWRAASTPLPVTFKMNTHSKKMFRISDIPLNEGLNIYVKIKTFGQTAFTKAGQVPIQIEPQDIQDVARGNVVRIVIVDPAREFQTSQFESLRLAPTENAVKRGKEIGKLIALVTLGNRDPKARGKVTSY